MADILPNFTDILTATCDATRVLGDATAISLRFWHADSDPTAL